ncbi:MAG: hypothetical protein KDE04_04730 [Anaerolineales bacterium]|nr:hypothetical protein [Anaerolineales bacterium]
MTKLYYGIDIGSITVKVVVLDEDGQLLAHRYERSQGQPRRLLSRLLQEMGRRYPEAQIAAVGLSGSGGGPVAKLLGCAHVNELVAQTRAVGEFYPQVKTVIEIGGQDSKFLSVNWDQKLDKMVLVDFAMNNLCAAGTGSFLDQQADRLGLAIEEEFAAIALQSQEPARVAGRCTVFAKSDMIHLQQKGTPVADILAGLCLALTRNYCSVIGKGKKFTPPILFQGGVAYNEAVRRAFETVLKLKPGELIVPQNHHIMAAIGTALLARDEHLAGRPSSFAGFGRLAEAVAGGGVAPAESLPILNRCATAYANCRPAPDASDAQIYVGIDVGSISTNVVAIDETGELLARRYLFTAGRPLEAVRQGLEAIGRELGPGVTVLGAGSTGSGRYLTAHYVGADVVRNEITAQARAAVAVDPAVDTIFEIGGQDSKFISIAHGAIVDFAMNAACAAGTGSFLQEQAEKLQIHIENEFSDLAFASGQPASLGERCTVFMESDLVHHQQQGATIPDLTAGLAYSIAENYLNRVVDNRALGHNIFFQGGVAWNESVVAAFRQLTGRSITVPPHHDVTGAIGVALLARAAREAGEFQGSQFRGFFLADRRYDSALFTCQQCPNLCEVNKVTIAAEPPIYFGARCDIFEEAGRRRANKAAAIPDLFAERTAMLLGDYEPPAGDRPERRRVAIPRSLTFYDMFPYWRAFFAELDIDIILSPATNPRVMRRTAETANVEFCLPAKLTFGHVDELKGVQADYLFLPSIINRENIAPGQQQNVYCPFIQAVPQLIITHLDLDIPVLTFPFFMQWQQARRKAEAMLAGELKLPLARVRRASAAAARAQTDFYQQLRARGRAVLAELGPDETAVVIVGRPYNYGDPGACQDLPYKLRRLGVLPIPMDFLPLESVDVSDYHDNMFWRSGQDILAAARLISADPRLQAIYLTNFSCGPDSFLLTFFNELIGDKPFLELEVDDHTADAGVITRCEAFLESIQMAAGQRAMAPKTLLSQEVAA